MVGLGAGFAYSNELVGTSGGRRENRDGTRLVCGFEFADAFKDFGDAFAFDVKQAAAEFRYGKLGFQVFSSVLDLAGSLRL